MYNTSKKQCDVICGISYYGLILISLITLSINTPHYDFHGCCWRMAQLKKSTSQTPRWVFCAAQYRECACYGKVRWGMDQNWLYISPAIPSVALRVKCQIGNSQGCQSWSTWNLEIPQNTVNARPGMAKVQKVYGSDIWFLMLSTWCIGILV